MAKLPEIMAPAGDFVSLNAALKAGADAVYFGVRGANMRAGAKNFSLADLKRVRQMCSEKNAKAYLTLNTVFFDREIPLVKKIIRAARKNGIDAIIAWDLSVVGLAREMGAEVFLSTQASTANAAAIAQYNRHFGIRRFVLARECSLEDIKKMRSRLGKMLGKTQAAKISFEVFAHGAMCVSESGRCFMSTFSCGKSANRGVCTQPCRREYNIYDPSDDKFSYKIGSGYVMSPKDLCTLPFIEKLVDSGVDSLKIEGRGRNAEYVYQTVKAYKTALDFLGANRRKKNFKESFESLKNGLAESLKDVFNRGFSDGFYFGRPVGDWTSSGVETGKRKIILGHVLKYYPKACVAEISVDNSSVKSGEEVQLEGDSTGFMRFAMDGFLIDSKPVDCARKGDVLTVKTPAPVRRGDRLFRF